MALPYALWLQVVRLCVKFGELRILRSLLTKLVIERAVKPMEVSTKSFKRCFTQDMAEPSMAFVTQVVYYTLDICYSSCLINLFNGLWCNSGVESHYTAKREVCKRKGHTKTFQRLCDFFSLLLTIRHYRLTEKIFSL